MVENQNLRVNDLKCGQAHWFLQGRCGENVHFYVGDISELLLSRGEKSFALKIFTRSLTNLLSLMLPLAFSDWRSGAHTHILHASANAADSIRARPRFDKKAFINRRRKRAAALPPTSSHNSFSSSRVLSTPWTNKTRRWMAGSLGSIHC